MADYTYNKNEGGLMPTGDYEVKLEEMTITIIPSGKEKLALRFRVRDDIEGQSYGNKVLFEDIWKEKESPEHFNRKRVNQLLGTQEIEDGHIFKDIYEVIEFMKSNNYLVVHVVTTFDEYKGEDVNKIAYYKSSKHKPQSLGGEQPKKPTIEIDDNQLPF